MAKIKVVPVSDFKVQYLYFCKGCGYEHAFELDVHQFNGDLEDPTVSPSLLENRNHERICHSFIVGGKIQYLGDCFHELAGQTIELPDVDYEIEMRKVASIAKKDSNGKG